MSRRCLLVAATLASSACALVQMSPTRIAPKVAVSGTPLAMRSTPLLPVRAIKVQRRAADANMVASFVLERTPGLILTAAISYTATAIAGKTALSPLLWAAVLGMALGGVTSKVRLPDSGIKFAKARLLRAGIILYGVKLSLQQIADIGAAGLLTDLFTIGTVMPLGLLLGSLLQLEPPLAALISIGAAICGCSAVAAAQPVVDGEAHEVAAAVGTVVVCGTAAMFLYPLLFRTVPLLAANPRLMGIYTGASVHELAGVVAAGKSCGPQVASYAVVTKLVRVCMLAPCLLLMSRLRSLRRATGDSGDAKTAVPVPWFALGFLSVVALNSVVVLPTRAVRMASQLSATALAMAVAALGLDTDLAKVRSLGPRPLLLAGALWLWLLFGVGACARVLVGAFA